MATTPNPFWVAVIIVVVTILFVLLTQMVTPPPSRPSAPSAMDASYWYSIQGQQDYTDRRASDVVFSDAYNPDLAFYPSENTDCSTEMKSWGNNRLNRNIMY